MTSQIAAWQNWTQNQIKLVYLWSCLTEAAPNPICAAGFSPEETCKRRQRQETRQLLLKPLWAYHFLYDRRLSGDTMRAAGQRRPDLVPEQTIASQCFPVSGPLLRPHLTAAPPVTTALSAPSCRRTGEGWINCLFLLLECFQRRLTKTDVLRQQETVSVNMLQHWPHVSDWN